MCKFYSAIVMYNGDIFHNPFTTNHEDLIEEFNIRDNGQDKFIRVEYSPENRNLSDLNSYKLKIDASYIPEWFEKYKQQTIDRLHTIVSRMIITTDKKLICGQAVILAESANITKIKSCLVYEMYDSSVVQKMYDSSVVQEMYDSSQSPKK